jgi:hypothetical protein
MHGNAGRVGGPQWPLSAAPAPPVSRPSVCVCVCVDDLRGVGQVVSTAMEEVHVREDEQSEARRPLLARLDVSSMMGGWRVVVIDWGE